MKVLAFDCSTVRGSVAIVENGTTFFSESFDCPRGRGGVFFQVLDRAVRLAGRPDRIAVGIGPGSYNGLRTALAAAEGLKLATGADVVGVPSVCALPCEGPEYVAVSDARGGVFYYVRIRNREVVGGFELLDPAAFFARLSGEVCPVFSAAPIPTAPQVQVAMPDAVILAGLGVSGQPSVETLEPLYLKPAHITKPRAR